MILLPDYYDGLTFRCWLCGEYEPVEDVRYHPAIGQLVCPSCYREHCRECGERMAPRGVVLDDDVCAACGGGDGTTDAVSQAATAAPAAAGDPHRTDQGRGVAAAAGVDVNERRAQ